MLQEETQSLARNTWDPIKGLHCIPWLVYSKIVHYTPTESLQSHPESSFPYHTDTDLYHPQRFLTRATTIGRRGGDREMLIVSSHKTLPRGAD